MHNLNVHCMLAGAKKPDSEHLADFFGSACHNKETVYCLYRLLAGEQEQLTQDLQLGNAETGVLAVSSLQYQRLRGPTGLPAEPLPKVCTLREITGKAAPKSRSKAGPSDCDTLFLSKDLPARAPEDEAGNLLDVQVGRVLSDSQQHAKGILAPGLTLTPGLGLCSYKIKSARG